MVKGAEYTAAWERLGRNYSAVAREYGVDESSVRKAVKLHLASEGLDPAVQGGMTALGMELPPGSGWIKNSEPDEMGRTFSFHFSNKKEEQTSEERLAGIEERFSGIPAVKFKAVAKPKGRFKKAFISVNDLHAGALAWGQETGYGDWDLDIAMTRLTNWLTRLITLVQAEGVSEIILYYNGDTLHTNGEIPLTPASGHMLDTDTRNFKAVDRVADTIITLTDLAAQVADVRLVIKRGNHDEDSYLALLQAAKWRYIKQANVTVEMDPSPYWAHIFGKVAIFGHHGDRIKFDRLVMTFQQKYRREIAEVEHITVYTAHKHERMVQQFPGVTVEQTSAWTRPDAYGAAWGDQSMAQAVIYDGELGEVARFTVKEEPSER